MNTDNLKKEVKEETKQFLAKETTYKVVVIAAAVAFVLGAIIF